MKVSCKKTRERKAVHLICTEYILSLTVRKTIMFVTKYIGVAALLWQVKWTVHLL